MQRQDIHHFAHMALILFLQMLWKQFYPYKEESFQDRRIYIEMLI